MALTEREIRNRDHVLALYRNVLDPHDKTRLREYLVEDYIQHSPEATDGLQGIGDFLDWLKQRHPGHRNHIQRIFAQDDFVIVHLRATGDYDDDLARFSYSFDGRSFEEIGEPVRLPYQLKTFQGTRYALFAFNASGHEGGHADFDGFRVHEPLADRSRNIPLGRVVGLSNLADGTRARVHPLGVLQPVAAGPEQAQEPVARFRVHDRGQGRVALEAMDGSGFLTVVGIGLAADVRLLPESADSLFLWQDMLRDRQFMLLSLRTGRYVGQLPGSGEPYAADRPGTRPDRRDGTVLVWDAPD